MDEREFCIQKKRLSLEKRRQNLSAWKFVVGILLLGFLGFVLDIHSFFYTRDENNRVWLSSHLPYLLERDPQIRLNYVSAFKLINTNQPKIQIVLDHFEEAAQNEIKAAEAEKATKAANEKLQEKIRETNKAESENLNNELLAKAREEERKAKEAAANAARQEEAARRAFQSATLV